MLYKCFITEQLRKIIIVKQILYINQLFINCTCTFLIVKC